MKKPNSKVNLNRRQFVKGAAISTLAIASSPIENFANNPDDEKSAPKFKQKYAPHFGMFKEHAGEDHIDQIKFMSDQGFTAMEDNGMMGRPVRLQEKIAAEMTRLEMTMGVFVAYAEFEEKTFVTNNKDVRTMLVDRMEKAVEVAKRNLKWCAEVCEPSGLIMVLEPLNPWTDHPGLILTKIPQAYQICKAVNNPSCKILDDLYHQQITEGNLIPNIDMAWSEIAYFQMGDNPGRKEPTTGEINYRNIFKHIYDKGYKGVLGMEHGKSLPGKKGETTLIEAYRYCDDF